jgi:hypothetical protein
LQLEAVNRFLVSISMLLQAADRRVIRVSGMRQFVNAPL